MPTLRIRDLLPKPAWNITGHDGSLKITRLSLFSGRRNTMTLPIKRADFDRWNNHGPGSDLIQNIFPHLSADQREFLMSGATPSEWRAEFGKEDEEGDSYDA